MALNAVCQDILWNIDIISALQVHETLLVFGNKLQIDNRRLQSLRRKFSDDSRDKIIAAISNTISLCMEVLSSYQYNYHIKDHTNTELSDSIYVNITDIENRTDNFLIGLKNLSTFERYTNDVSFQIQIGHRIREIRKIKEKCVYIKDIFNKSKNSTLFLKK